MVYVCTVVESIEALIQEPLTEAERFLIERDWNAGTQNLTYADIAAGSSYTEPYLRNVGSELWQALSEALGQKTVGKRNWKRLISAYLAAVDAPPSGAWHNSEGATVAPNYQIMGDPVPIPPMFYGRDAECAQIKTLVLQKRCVIVTGAMGIGKTTVAAKLIQDFNEFDRVIWKSISVPVGLERLVDEVLSDLNDTTPRSGDPIDALLNAFKSQRCLLVLDGAEALLQSNASPLSSHIYLDDRYRQFFQRLVQSRHSGTVLILSRCPFNDLRRLQESGYAVGAIAIGGLNEPDATLLLSNQGIQDSNLIQQLIEDYRGNPLKLNRIAASIRIYGAYSNTILVDPFADLLYWQFQSLAAIDCEIMRIIAQTAPISCDQIYQRVRSMRGSQAPSPSMSEVVAALTRLSDLSLIEQVRQAEIGVQWQLEPVIRKYTLTYLLPPQTAAV